MRLYRPTWRRGGAEHTCTKWYAQFHVNGRLYRRALGTSDKRFAEEKARALFRREERRAAGLLDPFEGHRDRPVKEHVDAFLAYLATKDVTEDHRKDRAHSLGQYLAVTTARNLGAIDIVEAQRWIADLAAGGLSARSANKRAAALRQFGAWVVRTRRLAHNPFQGLASRNEETDRRRVRRALTDAEVVRLLDAARARPLERARVKRTRSGVSAALGAKLATLGAARAFLYECAVGTGLRRGELQGLAWRDIDEAQRVLTVRATVAKSKRMQDLPLRRDLLDHLAEHRARLVRAGLPAGPQDRVFPGRLFPTHGTFRADLAHAGLAGADDQGRVVDMHSLRQTFITRLSVAKVHPRVAMALARHSRLELTMRTYTDTRLLDLRGAVEALPGLPDGRPAPEAEARRA